MIIQHNLPAMNASRMLGVINRKASSNLEKLSSGFRVNRAADDAAGLAISEKMRGQIRGLSMAEMNVQHGIAMIQTAEGGTQEIHSLLQRMRELSVQSSNGTYQGEDREQLDKEFQALKEEITRIAESTHFNGVHLLIDNAVGADASGIGMTGTKMEVLNELTGGLASVQTNNHGLPIGKSVVLTDDDARAALGWWPGGVYAPYGTFRLHRDNTAVSNPVVPNVELLLQVNNGVWTATITNSDYSNNGPVTLTGDGSFKFHHNSGDTDLAFTLEIGGGSLDHIKANADPRLASGNISFDFGTFLWVAVNTFTGTTVNAALKPDELNLTFNYNRGSSGANNHDGWTVSGEKLTGYSVTGFDGQFVTLDDGTNSLTVDIGKTLTEPDDDSIQSGGFTIDVDVTSGYVTPIDTTSLMKAWVLGDGDTDPVILQIGANGTADQRLAVNRFNLRATNLGEAGAWLSDASISMRENANSAIDIVDKAINQVSSVRAYFGAAQNRLEHTLNNLGITKENLTAAESTIRDVDMAKEMMEFTKNNILVQAAQSMLAQANQLPQGILSLLR